MADDAKKANCVRVKYDRRNYRKHDDRNKKLIRKSLEELGAGRSVVIDAEDELIAGNGVFEQAEALGIKTKIIETDGSELVVVKRTDLHTEDEKRKKLALADNATSDSSSWDVDALKADWEPEELDEWGVEGVWEEEGKKYDQRTGLSLAEKYIVPPFSILDSRQGYWQERKTEWKTIIHSHTGREASLLGDGLAKLAKSKSDALSGTSIFDPVLCEVLYRWFCPAGGTVIDPFSGGSVRGLVAAMLGNDYTGVDLRPEQIAANEANYKELQGIKDFAGEDLRQPEWIVGDSCNIDTLIDKTGFDFALTCPPYGDLEQYSDDPADLSNMEYQDFVKAYREIIRKTVDKLKENAFFAIVIGDIRDKKGFYRDFIGDTKKSFFDAGCKLYNYMILVEQISTGALRCDKVFSASRKVVKTHQDVLIFCKGNPRSIVLSNYPIDLQQ